MSEEIKTLVFSKCKHLPESLQDYLDDIFSRFVRDYEQQNLSSGSFGSMLNSVEFIVKMEENDKYVLGINYSPESISFSSIPRWEIIWKKGNFDKEVTRIDGILEWIFITHSKVAAKNDFPKYFSRCQEKKVEFTGLNGQSINLPLREIIYFMAEGDYTRVFYGHRSELQSILVDISLRGAESMMMPFNFYRIHRSYMVNLGCIRSINTTKSLPRISLCSGTELPLARRRRTALQDRINPLTLV